MNLPVRSWFSLVLVPLVLSLVAVSFERASLVQIEEEYSNDPGREHYQVIVQHGLMPFVAGLSHLTELAIIRTVAGQVSWLHARA